MSNQSIWEQENRALRVENERLRRELAIIERPTGILEMQEMLDTANERIEEMEEGSTFSPIYVGRLESAAENQKRRIEELKAAWEAEVKANGELERRIEELEREFNFWHSVALDYKRDLGEYMRRGPDSLTWEPISHAQIDAAWEHVNNEPYNNQKFSSQLVEEALKELGIERCDCLKWEHINGVCQNCNGHKWVIGGDDE